VETGSKLLCNYSAPMPNIKSGSLSGMFAWYIDGCFYPGCWIVTLLLCMAKIILMNF